MAPYGTSFRSVEAPVDHRQPIGTFNVPSVIHALRSVGKTTTIGVVVFFIGITTYISPGVVYGT